MAYKITDFTRSLAPHTGYPYGDTQDDPSGTLVNRLAMNDLFLFFQRLCATNGITPSSNADNDTNGYQFVQALNALVNNGQNAFANNYQNDNNPLDAICITGVTSSSSGPTTTISNGFIFYNGQFVKVNSFSYTTIPGGYDLYCSISTVDSLPIGTISFLATGTTDTTSHFLLSHLVSSKPFGLPLGDYVNGFLATLIVKRTGTTVNIQGTLDNSAPGSIVIDTNICTLPFGYRPATTIFVPIIASLSFSVPYLFTIMKIATSGLVTILGSKSSFDSGGGTGAIININFEVDI